MHKGLTFGSELIDTSPMNLDTATELHIVQRKELGEVLLGFEGRNKYEIREPSGIVVGFAAEQSTGIVGAIARAFLRHWRTFDIHIFDSMRSLVMRAHHPFRIFFQRLEIYDSHNQFLGALQQRWAFFTKRFDVEDSQGQVVLEMRSGLFKIWTFPFFRGEQEIARIEKKWSGTLTEIFTDADRFRLVIPGRATPNERRLLLASALFVDLQYFENNQGSKTVAWADS